MAERERKRRWREQNPDKHYASNKRWADNNPEKVRAKSKDVYERKAALIREAKSAPCADCGGLFPPWVMDLDHVRGEKCFSPAKGATKSFVSLRAEIEKCVVVCANCHRERTHGVAKGEII